MHKKLFLHHFIKILKKPQIDKYRRNFEMIDLKKDGYLDAEEIEAALQNKHLQFENQEDTKKILK
jgi:Ca2+-binding EF-hand superfamily protein